jgi:DNA-binding transcriptional MerR regulator
MSDHQEQQAASIAAVERDTGLSKDTLRVWERRYGFPHPARDEFGERRYSAAEVDKLRVIKRLIDQGHRPGKIIELPLPELQHLARNGEAAKQARVAASAERPAGASVDLDPYLELLKAHRIDDLRSQFAQAILRLGLAQFVLAIVAPMNGRVGDAWTRGYFEVFEEHLYTETVQVVLRNAINAAPPAGRRPNVLLTTFPQEAHGLGILMAEAMFALERCHCVSLGIQTPIRDIVLAAEAQRCDIVALSFSSSLGPNPVLDGLGELRAMLPATTEIWAGGSCHVLQRRPPAYVRTFGTLDPIAPAVAQWRAAYGVA